MYLHVQNWTSVKLHLLRGCLTRDRKSPERPLATVSCVKDSKLSLVYVYPKKKVTYLGGQVGDQAWKFCRHWVKAGRIGDPTGRNVEPWTNSHLTLNHCCTAATFWSITVEIDHKIVVSSFFSFVFLQTESKTSSSIHLWSISSSTDINRGNSWWISVERFDYGETWIQVCFDPWICFFIVSLNILTTGSYQ